MCFDFITCIRKSLKKNEYLVNVIRIVNRDFIYLFIFRHDKSMIDMTLILTVKRSRGKNWKDNLFFTKKVYWTEIGNISIY